jgi:hypothetical protein
MPDPRDTLPWEWNADGVAGYWARRPVAVARRTIAVTFAGFSIGLALLIDKATGTFFLLLLSSFLLDLLGGLH